jgi:hypothetical protein
MTQPPQDRAARVEQRLAVPVVLAALAAVPATFLSMLEGTAADVGNVLNWASLAVLTGESLVLLALTEDPRGWLRTHRLPLAVALATIPAVLLALGPVQILRLLRFVGALRIIRVRRMLRAGAVLRRRIGGDHPLGRALTFLLSASAALFVALVLADPTSQSRQLLDEAIGGLRPVAVLAAGALLAAATLVVARRRGRFRQGSAEQALPSRPPHGEALPRRGAEMRR